MHLIGLDAEADELEVPDQGVGVEGGGDGVGADAGRGGRRCSDGQQADEGGDPGDGVVALVRRASGEGDLLGGVRVEFEVQKAASCSAVSARR